MAQIWHAEPILFHLNPQHHTLSRMRWNPRWTARPKPSSPCLRLSLPLSDGIEFEAFGRLAPPSISWCNHLLSLLACPPAQSAPWSPLCRPREALWRIWCRCLSLMRQKLSRGTFRPFGQLWRRAVWWVNLWCIAVWVALWLQRSPLGIN